MKGLHHCQLPRKASRVFHSVFQLATFSAHHKSTMRILTITQQNIRDEGEGHIWYCIWAKQSRHRHNVQKKFHILISQARNQDHNYTIDHHVSNLIAWQVPLCGKINSILCNNMEIYQRITNTSVSNAITGRRVANLAYQKT